MSNHPPLPPEFDPHDFDPHDFAREPGQMPEGGCLILAIVLVAFPAMLTAAVTGLYWLVWVLGRGLLS